MRCFNEPTEISNSRSLHKFAQAQQKATTFVLACSRPRAIDGISIITEHRGAWPTQHPQLATSQAGPCAARTETAVFFEKSPEAFRKREVQRKNCSGCALAQVLCFTFCQHYDICINFLVHQLAGTMLVIISRTYNQGEKKWI